MNDQEKVEYLEDLLQRVISELRPYARPGMVRCDVFPHTKEAIDYIDGNVHKNKVTIGDGHKNVYVNINDDQIEQSIDVEDVAKDIQKLFVKMGFATKYEEIY